MNFLMGLNDSFPQTRGKILLIDPNPSINRVFCLLNHEKKHKSMTNDSY